jgi:hypothetical protein
MSFNISSVLIGMDVLFPILKGGRRAGQQATLES